MKKRKSVTNRNGEQVPVSTLTSIELKRHNMVEKVISRALKLEARIEKEKEELRKLTDDFINFAFESHEIKVLTSKGNTTIMNHGQDKKIMITSPDVIAFNEQIQVAFQMMRECVQEWVADGRDELKALLAEITRVDKQGRVNQSQILRVQKIESPDPRWQKAQKILRSSIEVIAAKTYMRFYIKDVRGNWKFVKI